MKTRLLYVLFGLFTICLLPTPILAAASANASPTLRTYITDFGGFLSDIILPLLFTIAVLFFLYNMATYFIIEGANDGSRAKAKQNAIYSVAAFVFLFTIWALVSVFLNGLGLTRDKSICPDYYELFEGTCVERGGTGFTGGGSFPTTGGGSGSTGGGSTGGTGSGSTGSGSTGSGSTGGGSGSGGSGSTGGGNSTGSGNGSTGSTGSEGPLAELVFGTGKDAAIFSTAAFSPESNLTQIIGANNTCTEGLNTLALVSRTDTLQTAYAYHKNNGAYRWTDIARSGSTNLINYFTTKLRVLAADTNAPLYIVHTHPVSRYRGLGLTMSGQGPSAADIAATCRLMTERPSNQIVNLIVSGTDLWSYTVSSSGCAAIAAGNATSSPTIETYTYLASLEASTRSRELTDYLAASITPIQYKNIFSTVNQSALASQSATEVLALATPIATSNGVTINQLTINNFCSTVQ